MQVGRMALQSTASRPETRAAGTMTYWEGNGGQPPARLSSRLSRWRDHRVSLAASQTKRLIERQQVLAPALVDYPLDQPSHRQGPNFLRRRRDQNEEDYAREVPRICRASGSELSLFHGSAHHASRRAASVSGKVWGERSLDDAGIASVSAWLADNGYALANFRDKAVVATFYEMRIPWTEAVRGLNVIFDLGVFLGESIVRKQPRLHWKYILGSSDHGEAGLRVTVSKASGRKPKGYWLDPPQRILGLCWSDLNKLYWYSPREVRNYDVAEWCAIFRHGDASQTTRSGPFSRPSQPVHDQPQGPHLLLLQLVRWFLMGCRWLAPVPSGLSRSVDLRLAN